MKIVKTIQLKIVKNRGILHRRVFVMVSWFSENKDLISGSFRDNVPKIEHVVAKVSSVDLIGTRDNAGHMVPTVYTMLNRTTRQIFICREPFISTVHRI